MLRANGSEASAESRLLPMASLVAPASGTYHRKMELSPRIVLDGLVFPECPRWHGGKLWFSDVQGRKIITIDSHGQSDVALATPFEPAGLGWTPRGTLLVVSTLARRLMHHDADGRLREVADLSALEKIALNDMTVDRHGRAYIGAWGFDLNNGAPPAMAEVFLVQPDGGVFVAASQMRFPNGMVITADGATMIIAETTARCLTAFDIGADGALANRRTWAALDTFPDGICLDAEGAIWVACPVTGECIRVREGGEVAARVKVEGKGVYACMLGGADRRTLYLCTATGTAADISAGRTHGCIEAIGVDVAGAGLP